MGFEKKTRNVNYFFIVKFEVNMACKLMFLGAFLSI